MQHRKVIYFSLVFFLVLSLILGGIIFYYQKNQELKIIFFDVGQGDAILLIEGQNQILIDGGPSGKKLLEKLGEHIPFWDRQIETVVATHPDADHIGGLVDAFGAYKIKTMIQTGAKSDSLIFSALQKAIEKEKSEVVDVKKNTNIKFPSGAEMNIKYPLSAINNLDEKDSNSGSVVAQLVFGENKFLFTGDLPSEQESELIKNNTSLNSNVLKVSHHGSKYATTAEFLEAVKPEEAIVSVGKNNRYGHPTQEVLDRLKNIGAKIFRTDEMGDITYECKVKSEKCKVIFQ